MSVKEKLYWLMCLLVLPGMGRAAEDKTGGQPLLVATPAGPAAPLASAIGLSDSVQTDLRQVQDAHGLALLVEDDASARQIDEVWKHWEKELTSKLAADPVIKTIDAQMHGLFLESITDRTRPVREFQRVLATIPVEKIKDIITKWLRMLFYERGILFTDDLLVMGDGRLDDLCTQARAMISLKGLSGWQARNLVWRYRDNEVRRLFAERDGRIATLTPITLTKKEMNAETYRTLGRYLLMVANLKRQVDKDSKLPFDRFRTLTGLLRGLRYMDTIRYAAEVTGMDHYLMTRLFIQESDFVHERVSPAGAFSVAQFMGVALKDVWQFRNAIPGGSVLLKEVKDLEDLRKKIIEDPRMAIKASCIYMRRLRDEVNQRMKRSGQRSEAELVTLLTLELHSIQTGIASRSALDALIEISRDWPVKDLVLLPFLPITGGVVPDSTGVLSDWMEKTVQSLVHIQLSESVYKKRLALLQSALGLAAYNAGMGNLIKSAKKQAPFDGLGFPVQLTETRNYVDEILDGTDVLVQVRQFSAGVFHLEWDELLKLTDEACRRASHPQKTSEVKAAP